MKGRLIVLAAPSGAGKTTIANALVARRRDLGFSVSATTRAPRPKEQDGRDYYFLSAAEFERRVQADDFIETAEYAGQRYGTLRAEIDGILASGRNVLLDIDVQGAAQVRRMYPRPQSLAIFLLPPSGQELVNRLRGRGTESHIALLPRLERASEELRIAEDFDCVVVNDNLEQAVTDVSAAIDTTVPLLSRQEVRRRIETLLSDLRETLDGLKREHTKGTV